MASYRFCRSDDIPLLVDAYNRCYRPHFAELPELTIDGFKALIRSHDLWTSSCMVAQAGDDPIAVLFSAKREEASLIYCVGVDADHQRNGHGRHLLTSLSQKLAILGPPTLLAEVPVELTSGRGLLEACGYRLDRSCPDFRRVSGSPAPASPAEALIVPITRSELESQGALPSEIGRPWLRSGAALAGLGEEARGLALLSDVHIEAWVLFLPSEDDSVTVLAMDAMNPAHRAPLLTLLLDRIEREYPGGAGLAGASEEEVPSPLMGTLGFEEVSRTAFYSATATPA